MSLNNYLTVVPFTKLLLLLSSPYKKYFKCNNSSDILYRKWIKYFNSAFDSRDEFLLSIKNSNETKILSTNYKKNYIQMKNNFKIISTLNIISNKNLLHSHDTLNSKLENLKEFEKSNKLLFQITSIQLVAFLFQYLNEFEEKSININLWNYCLKSMYFSYKNFFIGIIVLICQYTYIVALLYHTINDFTFNPDPLIILITIISTILSILYSYNTINSYINSLRLYKFLIKIYSDYPSIVIKNNTQINMTKNKIKYNMFADFLSNLLIPLIIPFINICIILNSETIVDAILNCMAIFFIIQIDEELFNTTEYKIEKYSITFTRWILVNIYCNTFSDFNNIFKLESEKIKKTYSKNKIVPSNMLINNDTASLY